MAAPDFSGFTPGSDTLSQLYAAIRAANAQSEWEAAVAQQPNTGAWASEVSSNGWSRLQKALNSTGWLGGGSGGGGGGGGTTPPPNPNGNALLQNSLSALGIGAVAGGPNYKISSPFRHLFGQDQIDAFAVKDPASLYKMGGDGKIQQANFNWWQPNASVGSYSPVATPSSTTKK